MSLFSKSSKLTLHYFNLKGRGELVRYVLKYAKAEFVDHRFGRDEWKKLKPLMPLASIPVLEFASKDGSSKAVLCQSNVIVRTLSSLYGLSGKTLEQTAKADEALESMIEIRERVIQWLVESEDARKDKIGQSLSTKLVPQSFGFISKRLKENNLKSVAGGNDITFGDLAVAQVVNDLLNVVPDFDLDKFKSQFPEVATHVKAVNELPQIKAYLASRPETPF